MKQAKNIQFTRGVTIAGVTNFRAQSAQNSAGIDNFEDFQKCYPIIVQKVNLYNVLRQFKIGIFLCPDAQKSQISARTFKIAPFLSSPKCSDPKKSQYMKVY